MHSQLNFHNLNNPEWQALLFQKGDETALAFFYREFHPALSLYASRWVGNREIAEEIASDALLKTWKMNRKLDSYAGIRAYLYTIVRRDSQKAAIKERRRQEINQLSPSPTPSSETPYHHTIRCEVTRILHNALRDIAPGSRQILTMHFLQGKSTGEIARELNLAPSTVKTQKTRGLQALRKKLIRSLNMIFTFW